jgi:hypothetical protein
MSYSGLLAHRCEIHRVSTNVSTDEGYTTPKTYVLLKEKVKCRIQNLFESSAGLRIQTSGITAENDYLGFFSKNEDIQKDDKVIWNSIELFVKPVAPLYDSVKIHHKEVYMGLSET